MQNVVKLLRSAGLAVKALANQSSESSSDVSDINSKKEAFTSATAQYFSLLSSVDVNLRRQIYALEEANIIPADAAQKESAPAPSLSVPGSQQTKEKPAAESGGLGSLDVGWLNSRNDKVDKEMEAELWAKMHSLLKGLDEQNKPNNGQDMSMS